MLPPFISDAEDKHPTCILASYGAECYRHSFPTLKTNTRHLFLASYGAECCRHSIPTLKTNTQHLFLASYGAECLYRHSIPNPDAKDKHPTFIFSVIGSRMLCVCVCGGGGGGLTFGNKKKHLNMLTSLFLYFFRTSKF